MISDNSSVQPSSMEGFINRGVKEMKFDTDELYTLSGFEISELYYKVRDAYREKHKQINRAMKESNKMV
jgi:hypothetical protein